MAEPVWLANKMFVPDCALTFRDEQLREFWAYVGICGGPVLLKRSVADFHAAWRPNTPPVLSVYLAPDAPVSLSAQAFVAAFMLPHNAMTAPILFETHLGLIELELEQDPVRKETKFHELQRRMVAYTRRLS